MTMRLYGTVCDQNYLARAVAMIESLKRHSSKPVQVSLLTLDEESFRAAQSLNIDGVIVGRKWNIELGDHTWQEFCWLQASQLCESHVGRHYERFTYLDADLFFAGDPEVIHQETGNRSVGIIPHRFIPSKKYLERNGQFNVSWISFEGGSFERETTGQVIANEWAAQCREWCYNRNEDGKFGDQKYLDEWPTKYGDAVHIIKNIGAGLAPWNYANYKITEGPKADGVQAVFVHLHEFADLGGKLYRLTNYVLRPEDKAFIYDPYIKAYEAAKAQLAEVMAPSGKR